MIFCFWRFFCLSRGFTPDCVPGHFTYVSVFVRSIFMPVSLSALFRCLFPDWEFVAEMLVVLPQL